MNKLGRILIVLADNIIALVTVPLYVTIGFIGCAFMALIERDIEWLTYVYTQGIREGLSTVYNDHVEFIKNGF